jgi:hypothetical protein
MKIINANVRGYLDYLVVLIFLCGPLVFDFSMAPAASSYSLASVHLWLTLLTDFLLGAVKVVPLKWHGIVELIVGPTLVALPLSWASVPHRRRNIFSSRTESSFRRFGF